MTRCSDVTLQCAQRHLHHDQIGLAIPQTFVGTRATLTRFPSPRWSSTARLERMANRIVWVNPRSAADEFEPLVGGMAAALPHCTTMVSGHKLRALREVVLALGK